MGTVGADFFAARAERGDGHGEDDFELFDRSARGSEATFVAHHADFAGDGGGLFAEIGELDVEVGGVGVEFFAESAEDDGNRVAADVVVVLAEDFEEPAHVGALEFAGEIDGESEEADRVLGAVVTLADVHGVLHLTDADSIDGDIALVLRALDVHHCGGDGVAHNFE